MTNYNLVRFNSTSVMGGLSYRISESYEMVTDKVQRRYWRYSRYYLNFSYAFLSNYHAYEFFNKNGGIKATEGFVEPSLSKLGWRLGADWVYGFKNSNYGMSFGIEVGKVAQYSNTYKGVTYKTPSEIFMIHIGMLYGQLTKK